MSQRDLTPPATVSLLQEREPRGYIGPCCHDECKVPAVMIVVLNVGGLIVTAWVCADHYEALRDV